MAYEQPDDWTLFVHKSNNVIREELIYVNFSSVALESDHVIITKNIDILDTVAYRNNLKIKESFYIFKRKSSLSSDPLKYYILCSMGQLLVAFDFLI